MAPSYRASKKGVEITLLFIFIWILSFSFLQEEGPSLSLCHIITLMREAFVLIIENDWYSAVPTAAIIAPQPQRGTSVFLTGTEQIPADSPDSESHGQVSSQGFASFMQLWQAEFSSDSTSLCPVVYTHLLPVILSDTVLMVNEFCRCN